MAYPHAFRLWSGHIFIFSVNSKANEIGTTGQVSVIGYFLPLFGVVGGAMFFNEELDASVLLGAVLILFAMTAIARGSIPFRNKRKISNG